MTSLEYPEDPHDRRPPWDMPRHLLGFESDQTASDWHDWDREEEKFKLVPSGARFEFYGAGHFPSGRRRYYWVKIGPDGAPLEWRAAIREKTRFKISYNYAKDQTRIALLEDVRKRLASSLAARRSDCGNIRSILGLLGSL